MKIVEEFLEHSYGLFLFIIYWDDCNVFITVGSLTDR